ncbi:MAG: BrnA antitoxin family protein [Deltaproteobacteria bacterium]|nr:BrnA antitoxin family protein [Deltaproteobacteria bacterium]
MGGRRGSLWRFGPAGGFRRVWQGGLIQDADVLEWYKSQGPRYQTRMNEVLRAAAFRDGTNG